MDLIEIVDLPIFIAWWIFPVRYVNVYQRVLLVLSWEQPLAAIHHVAAPLPGWWTCPNERSEDSPKSALEGWQFKIGHIWKNDDKPILNHEIS
jgi:hypothetical protein